MITKDEVQTFLDSFHTKMKIFGIIYRDDRGKNQRALEELEFPFISQNTSYHIPLRIRRKSDEKSIHRQRDGESV